jgi:hypothetical protein
LGRTRLLLRIGAESTLRNASSAVLKSELSTLATAK